MTKTVQLLFEKNKIVLPVAAEIDMMYEDEMGFIISIFTIDPTWQKFTGFPCYVAFAFGSNNEPRVAFVDDEYGEMVIKWRDYFSTSISPED